MKKLLAAKAAFGIIPGGSEDVAIHEHGKENVYINSRYGFIKYALQHGYSLILAYTFGENDQFYSLSCLRPLNLWLVKRFLDVFLMGGTWCLPVLVCLQFLVVALCSVFDAQRCFHFNFLEFHQPIRATHIISHLLTTVLSQVLASCCQSFGARPSFHYCREVVV